MLALILAFLSGIPALVYEVVFTRQVALVVGSQVEAISAVLVAFFGGLALGARLLGARADRSPRPLRTYGALELAAGGLALLALLVLEAMRRGLASDASDALRLGLAGAAIVPATFALGGTLPALLRAMGSAREGLARRAGWLVGLNTVGGVIGVLLTAILVPSWGLRASLLGAVATSLTLGALALVVGGRRGEPAGDSGPAFRVPASLLISAALVGAATLAYEVLAARMAALWLGSSLYAWAFVLALFLTGLAGGNALAARRASRSPDPGVWLGWIELGAAFALGLGLIVFAPSPGREVVGPSALATVAIGVLPVATLMGASFPFFVRAAIPDAATMAAAFGRLSAYNTAGGLAGALLAPFVLLPMLGPVDAAIACALVNAGVGLYFLTRTRPGQLQRVVVGAATVTLVAPLLIARVPEPAGPGMHILYTAHGAQASVAVVRKGGHRTLLVDGDPEASTAGNARRTEELLALLPLARHPDAKRLLEIGLGSGISLGTASRFGLERIECVEISAAVLEAAPYFAPDNANVMADDRPIEIVRGDGRAYLARHPGEYDVVLANTVHPWSLGATGLYSRAYFERLSRALRPRGIAVQWLPVERIGAARLAAILRTFFAVFPEGELWWAAESLLAIGSNDPLAARLRPLAESHLAPLRRLGIHDREELERRRIAPAPAVRAVLSEGAMLSDDRPTLEFERFWGRGASGGELALVEQLAREAAKDDSRVGPLALWLRSRVLRRGGDTALADALESAAERGGLELARSARLERTVHEAARASAGGERLRARRILDEAVAEQPDHRDARLVLAAIAREQADLEEAKVHLERLLAAHPHDGEGWNLLGVVQRQRGDLSAARTAFERALESDPFLPEALANAGLTAAEAGDLAVARRMLARLRAISPLGPTSEERVLQEALGEGKS